METGLRLSWFPPGGDRVSYQLVECRAEEQGVGGTGERTSLCLVPKRVAGGSGWCVSVLLSNLMDSIMHTLTTIAFEHKIFPFISSGS